MKARGALTEYERKFLARLLSQAAQFKPFFKPDCKIIAEKLGIDVQFHSFLTGQKQLDLDASFMDSFQVEQKERKPRRGIL
jgi:hypothetical protein